MLEGVGLFSVVTLLVITISFDVTQACSCLPSTVQSDYCSASQVMKVRLNLGKESVWIIPSNTSLPARPATAAEITNDLDHQGEMYTRYRYKRRELYKGKKPQTKFAYTRYHSNICGGTLRVGESIVMGGLRTVNNKTAFEFGLCNFNKLVESIDAEVLRRIEDGEYDSHCDCQIRTCDPDGCQWNPPASVDECIMYAFTQILSCYDHSWCEKDDEGVCGWQSTCLPPPPTTTTTVQPVVQPDPVIPPF